MTREEYIRTYSRHVLDTTQGRPLFPSVMMAQAILESADRHGVPGNSVLASVGKNHFGIKAGPSWKGKILTLPTFEVIDGVRQKTEADFRAYERDQDSFIDRAWFLLKNKRYEKGGVFSASSADLQAAALQAAGYATDPEYANKLIALMKKYDLYELDRMKALESRADAALTAGQDLIKE